MEKYCTVGQITDNNIEWWVPKSTNTHSEYITHFFSTSTMVARMSINVTL